MNCSCEMLLASARTTSDYDIHILRGNLARKVNRFQHRR